MNSNNKSFDAVIMVGKYALILLFFSLLISFFINIYFFLLPDTAVPSWMVAPFLQEARALIIGNSSNKFFNVASAIYFKNIIVYILGFFSAFYVCLNYEIRFISLKHFIYSVLAFFLYIIAGFAIFIDGPDTRGVYLTNGNIYLGSYFSGVFMITLITPTIIVFLMSALSLCLHMRKKIKIKGK